MHQLAARVSGAASPGDRAPVAAWKIRAGRAPLDFARRASLFACEPSRLAGDPAAMVEPVAAALERARRAPRGPAAKAARLP